jgi:hypothetical protein
MMRIHGDTVVVERERIFGHVMGAIPPVHSRS